MKLKRVISTILVSVLAFTMTVSADYLPPTSLWYGNLTRSSSAVPGAVAETPDKYKFTYEGQEFVILDKYIIDGKTCFFVMCESVYGTHPYSTAQSEPYGWFNPSDSNNIAYWLNNDFWDNGNGGKRLPDGLKNYIVESDWVTEPLRDDAGSGHVPDGYKSTSAPPSARCKLAILADWEWKTYIDRIGYPGDTWFFRTVRTVDIKNSTANVLAGVSGAVGWNATVAANSSRGIRPVFMLDSDFFANCKLSGIGSESFKAIDDFCNPDLYTDEERKTVFGQPKAEITQISGNAVIGQTIEVKYNYSGIFKENNTQIRWLRASDLNSVFTEISGANNKEYKISDADSDMYLKVEIIPGCDSKTMPTGDSAESDPIGPVIGVNKVNQAIQEIKNAPPETVVSVVEKYNSIFEVDTILSDLSLTAKSNFEVIFSNADFSAIDELRTEYNRAIALAKLNENSDSHQTGNYLDEKLQLDLSRFNELKDKQPVYDAITNKNYTDFYTFEKDFYESVCLLEVNNADRNNIRYSCLL